MRTLLAGCLVALTGGPSGASEIKWPDPTIPVPARVQAFIVAECRAFAAAIGESLEECIDGESYGYRATVEMLRDEAHGEAAAVRYRACQSGPGRDGGRFHRRKADCIGRAFGIVRQFEYTDRAEFRDPDAMRRAGVLPELTAGPG